MKLTTRLLTLGTLVLALAGCSSSDLDTNDTGGVTLSITDFDGLPIAISAGNDTPGPTVIGEVTITSVVTGQSGDTSSQMNVEIEGIEVSFSRADRGTRLPPRFIDYTFGVVPVNGTLQITNQPVLKTDQFMAVPIKDLVDFGIDTETGSQVIALNVTLKAFGRTISGRNVQSNPATFSLEVRP